MPDHSAASLRRLPRAKWPTRQLILLESSRLFAERGYLGTSTRDITTAVGIRQPSLYNHFASKQEIAETLLDRDLDAGLAFMRPLLREQGSPAVRLYRYLLWEVAHCLDDPFDLRALYEGGLMDRPEFRRGRAKHDAYQRMLRSLVKQGVECGEFIDIDVEFARAAIDALVMETIRASGRHKPRLADQEDVAASFTLRALLRRPSTLRSIRTRAHAAEAAS